MKVSREDYRKEIKLSLAHTLWCQLLTTYGRDSVCVLLNRHSVDVYQVTLSISCTQWTILKERNLFFLSI